MNVYFAHDEKSDVPLKVRTDKANRLGADFYVSLQADAFNGVMGDHGGITTFLYPSAPAKTRQIAKVFQRNLIAATGLRDRGVKDKGLARSARNAHGRHSNRAWFYGFAYGLTETEGHRLSEAMRRQKRSVGR